MVSWANSISKFKIFFMLSDGYFIIFLNFIKLMYGKIKFYCIFSIFCIYFILLKTVGQLVSQLLVG